MHAWRTPAPGILQRNTCHNYAHGCYPCVAICHCAHALFLSLGIHGMPLAFSTAEQLCIPGAAYRAGKSVCQRSRVRLHNLPRSQQAAGLKWIVFCVNFVYFFSTRTTDYRYRNSVFMLDSRGLLRNAHMISHSKGSCDQLSQAYVFVHPWPLYEHGTFDFCSVHHLCCQNDKTILPASYHWYRFCTISWHELIYINCDCCC